MCERGVFDDVELAKVSITVPVERFLSVVRLDVVGMETSSLTF